ncbi:MAG: hypothetical protein SVK44_08075 [Nitrospirota bacterium]|nr:hypothetical protein [Nitrospirota bacterium]
MANNRQGFQEALDSLLLALPPIGRVALGVLPAAVIILALEVLLIRPKMQDYSLLSIQERTTRVRLVRVREEIQEGGHLKFQAKALQARLEQTLGRLKGPKKDDSLTALDKMFQEGRIVLIEEPSIEPAGKGEYPAPLERLSASIETSYPSFAWTLARLPLEGLAYIPENFALKPSAQPKPGELYTEIPLKGKVGFIRVLSEGTAPEDVAGGARGKGL